MDFGGKHGYRTGIMHRPTIAFDLDGTLVDSAPDLLNTLNVVLAGIKLGPVPHSQTRNLVGGGARVLIERGLALHGVQLPEAAVDRLFAQFLEHYEVHLADQSLPFPGVVEALDQLQAQDARLIVVTNKIERFSVKLLGALGLADRFAVIAGPDTYGVRKPDPGHLLTAIARSGGHSTSAVMIGDSETDVTLARRAKVPVVAVSWGYSSIPVRELNADRLVDRFAEIPEAAAALLASAGARA
jgi:phosphoglycolate phosphatase